MDPRRGIRHLDAGRVCAELDSVEDYVGKRGLDRQGKKKWRQRVADAVARLVAALEPDDVVLGGGNVKKLKDLPPGCRAGQNANAFLGGFCLWAEPAKRKDLALATTRSG